MKFNGCSCVGCNNIFNETDDVVVCPVCGSPQHRACWSEHGKCANSALHGEGFSWTYPEHLKKTEKTPEKEAPIETNLRFRNGENAVMCPHCKALNYGNDAFCMKCRNPLFDEKAQANESSNNDGFASSPMNEETQNGPGFSDGPEFRNGYASQEEIFDYYQRFGGLRPDIMIEGIPASEYADYIGEKKSGAYIRKFVNMERFGRKISVSICALLFGPIWFLYRKLYKEGLLYAAALIILALLTGIFSLTDQSKLIYDEMAGMYGELMNGEITLEEFQADVDALNEKYENAVLSEADSVKSTVCLVLSLISFAVSLFMVFSADRLYLKKIKKDVFTSREQCSDMLSYRRMLHEKGGVSVGGAALGIALYALIYILELLPSYIYIFSTMAK